MYSTLQGLLWCIVFCTALEKSCKISKFISLEKIRSNPYGNRHFRRLIDSCAFTIYAPWVKRGEEQNRAALFENTIKKLSKFSGEIDTTSLIASTAVSFTLSSVN